MIAIAQPCREKGTRSEARNKEVARCLKMQPDYILFLDDDQTMPDEALELLIGLDTDIAVMDTPPHDSDLDNVTFNPDGSIAYCTIACSLIKRNVFEVLPSPWFLSTYNFISTGNSEGKLLFQRLDKSVDDNVGEDIYFIRTAVDAGLGVKIISFPKCKHFKL